MVAYIYLPEGSALAKDGILEFYPWYIQDWLGDEDVAKLSWAEKGFYRALLDKTWERGDLPGDLEVTRTWIQCDRRDWCRYWPKVARFFTLCEDGNYHNAKVDEKRPKVLDKKAGRSKAGKAGNEARWLRLRSQSEGIGNPDAIAKNSFAILRARVQTQTQTEPPLPPAKIEFRNFGAELEDWVERLYARHPKKIDKGLVGPALFDRWQKTENVPALMVEIDRAHSWLCTSPDWRRDNGRYIPQLARWIVDEGWKDPMAIAALKANVVQNPKNPNLVINGGLD